MAINKGMNISSVLNKSGKFGRIAGRFSKTLFGPEVGGDAIRPEPIRGYKIKDALDEFDGGYDDDELRLMRIKFMSEVAN